MGLFYFSLGNFMIGRYFVRVGGFTNDVCRGQILCPQGANYLLEIVFDESTTNYPMTGTLVISQGGDLCAQKEFIISKSDVRRYGSKARQYLSYGLSMGSDPTNSPPKDFCSFEKDKTYDFYMKVNGINNTTSNRYLWLSFQKRNLDAKKAQFHEQYGGSVPY